MGVSTKSARTEATASSAGSAEAGKRDTSMTSTTKLVLLRHGESTWNLENRFTGWTDVDLIAEGREEAQRGRPPAARRRLRLRRRLHLGAEARDPHALDRARGAWTACGFRSRTTGA